MSVSRDLFSGVQQHYITRNYITFRNLNGQAITYHLHRDIIVDLVKYCKLPVGFLLEIETKACRQNDCQKNTYRLKENFESLVQNSILIYRYGYRQYPCHHKDYNQGIRKLFKKFLPYRLLLRRSQYIHTIHPTAFGNLGIVKT